MVRPRGARHGKTEAQKEHLWPVPRGRDVSKRILMEFTVVSNEILNILICNSKLAGPRRNASRWINLAQEDHSYCPSSDECERKKLENLTEQISRNAPMTLWSGFRTVITIMNRLHRESGEERPEAIPVHQYQRWHSSSSSSSSTSWWQWNENWWGSYLIFLKENCCSKIAYS